MTMNDCDDCIKNGGDYECDHDVAHCKKGKNLYSLINEIKFHLKRNRNRNFDVKLISAIGEINKIVNIIPSEEWVPVIERLPDTKRKVLVTYRLGVMIASYDSEKKLWISVGRVRKLKSVTAWRELPKPYKEKLEI